MADNLKWKHCCRADIPRQLVGAEAGTAAATATLDANPMTSDLVAVGR